MENELENVEDQTYWSHLGAIGLQSVRTESERIKSDKDFVASGTRSLAFEQYPTFIATSDCGKDAAVHLEASLSHAQVLTEKLPPLKETCSEFENEAKTLSVRRKSTSLVLARHTRLLEILELPQLVETCVRNSHYDEALELIQYASRIEKKLGNIPIVTEVVKAVKGSSRVMLNQLLSQLRMPIQLPSCLKVVGYLRRMDAFGETELRLRFLQARDSWLTSTLKAVPNEDPYEHLSKSLELTRVHLFDIVTQYRALFSDEESAYASSTSHRTMFSTWLESKINQFLNMLENDLNSGAKKHSLDSIISQAMYFGQSLGKVGADFRPALVGIFSNAALENAFDHLKGAEQKFKSGISQMALKAITSKKEEAKKTEENGDFQPPLALLDFLPLAELCNSILMSLNELRLVAPIFIAPNVTERIQNILISSVQTLKEREGRFGKSSIDTERATFQTLVTVFAQKFLPFIDKCLKRIFPVNQQILVTSDVKIVLDTEKILDEIPLKDVLGELHQLESIKDEQKDEQYVIDRVSVIAQEIENE